MGWFGLIFGIVVGLITYTQQDDLHGALLWFIWGAAMAIMSDVGAMRQERRQRRELDR